MARHDRRLQGLIGAAVVIAGTVIWLTLRLESGFEWQLVFGFGVLALLAEQFPITLSRSTSYSVSFVVVIAATIVAGPAEAALANLFSSLELRTLRQLPGARLLFNAAQLGTAAGLGALAYRAMGGPVGDLRSTFPEIFLPLAACTAINFLVNTLMVSAAVATDEGAKVSQVWREQYPPLITGYGAFALLGLMLATLHVNMGWASVLFLLLPLLVARNAFQASVKMQDAYDATVRALMAAIEAKDPYTRGHAGRVAELSEMVAAEYGLPKETQRQVRYAALMHDVGKLVVDSKVLKKPGKFTADEYEHMKIHPIRGHAILGEIELLQSVIDGVRHHHEKLDGTGYPDGIAGDAIPLSARLIMVADAFDSMTSTRSYRPPKTIEGAIDELRRYSGTQFDPEAVKALETAITKRGWQPQPESRPESGSPLPHPKSANGGDPRAATF